MNAADLQNIKRLIWLYFWLLIFEGALRKWITPQLATPLLVVRGPLVILIYAYACAVGRFPWNGWVVSLTGLSLIMLAAGFVSGPGDPFVTVFGWQANFLHLPLMFVMARFMSQEDVRKFGKWILLLTIPMGVLMALQFSSSPGAWVNRGAGEGAMQMEVEAGRIRPAGTFSFNLGAAYFFALATAFVIWSAIVKRQYPMWLAGAAGVATLVAAATSGSRLFLASVAVVGVSLLVIIAVRPQMAAGVVKIAAVAALALVILGSLEFMRAGMNVMETRLQRASKSEGGFVGFVGRFTGGMTEPFQTLLDVPVLGHGLGLGTNAGARMMGKQGFVLAEREWPRVIQESGPVLGPLFLLWRTALVVWMGLLCIRCARAGNALPTLLFAASSLIILQGQFGQPTAVGFAAFGGGLCLASMRWEVSGRRFPSAVRERSQDELPRPVAAAGRRDRMEW